MAESLTIWNKERATNKVEGQAEDSKVVGKEVDKATGVAMVAAAEVEVEAKADKVDNPEAATTKVQQMERFISANTQLN